VMMVILKMVMDAAQDALLKKAISVMEATLPIEETGVTILEQSWKQS